MLYASFSCLYPTSQEQVWWYLGRAISREPICYLFGLLDHYLLYVRLVLTVAIRSNKRTAVLDIVLGIIEVISSVLLLSGSVYLYKSVLNSLIFGQFLITGSALNIFASTVDLVILFRNGTESKPLYYTISLTFSLARGPTFRWWSWTLPCNSESTRYENMRRYW